MPGSWFLIIKFMRSNGWRSGFIVILGIWNWCIDFLRIYLLKRNIDIYELSASDFIFLGWCYSSYKAST